MTIRPVDDERNSRVLCTLFDHGYLSRGLALLESIHRHNARIPVIVLCLSPECHDAMGSLKLPNVTLISLNELEAAIPGLSASRKDRSQLEYYFTCMAALHRYVFDTVPSADTVMYVDADMFFFDDPARVFDAIGDAPVAIIPHNFQPRSKSMERFGLYNAGWSAFRRTEEGLRCLDWWLARCVEWCHARVDGGRYANQLYLNHFSEIAPHTRVLTQKGFDAAPWNVGGYKVSRRDGRIYCDDDPLIFFHFHDIRNAFECLYFDSHRVYGAPLQRLVRNYVYRPYIAELVKMNAIAKSALGDKEAVVLRHRAETVLGIDVRRVLRDGLRVVYGAADLMSGRPIVVLDSKIL